MLLAADIANSASSSVGATLPVASTDSETTGGFPDRIRRGSATGTRPTIRRALCSADAEGAIEGAGQPECPSGGEGLDSESRLSLTLRPISTTKARSDLGQPAAQVGAVPGFEGAISILFWGHCS